MVRLNVRRVVFCRTFGSEAGWTYGEEVEICQKIKICHLEIWTEMAQQQPKLEDMGKYIKKIVEWDPTLNEYDAVRICRFRQIYYDDLEKFRNIVYYYRHSRRRERSASDGMLLRLAEIASRIETAEKTIRSEQKQERIAYFRILVETGIRHTQLMDLREENLKGNQIELLDKKNRWKYSLC